MEEEFNQENASTQTLTAPEVKETKVGLESLNDLPRIEDLLRSENEIKTTQQLKGLKSVENTTQAEDKPFALKQDEHKNFIKKRVKVLTSVYIAVCTLLFAFVFGNAITMAVLSNHINSNMETIQSQQDLVNVYKGTTSQNNTPQGSLPVRLNEPRDYSDDTKELTFFDKLSILFRNIFS